jgi:hypothetical protein
MCTRVCVQVCVCVYMRVYVAASAVVFARVEMFVRVPMCGCARAPVQK